MNKEPDTYEELIRKKRCIDLAKYYSLTDDNLEKVRGFVTRLGAEFVAIFDALWTHGDESKLERLAEAKLAEMPGGGIRR